MTAEVRERDIVRGNNLKVRFRTKRKCVCLLHLSIMSVIKPEILKGGRMGERGMGERGGGERARDGREEGEGGGWEKE